MDFLQTRTSRANIRASLSRKYRCQRPRSSSDSPSLARIGHDENKFKIKKSQSCSVGYSPDVTVDTTQDQFPPSSPTLSDLFEQESPVRESRLCSVAHDTFDGKPTQKSSNPFARSRTQYQRSWSMFESPQGMILKTEHEGDDSQGIHSSPSKRKGRISFPNMRDVDISVLDSEPILRLPHFVPDDESDNLPRIDKFTLLDIMNGKYQQQFKRVLIIDCRFEYEYDGGHIQGAINHWDKEALADELLDSSIDDDGTTSTALVFHCEFSVHRAPIMAKYIRHKDRAANANEYPKLSYPELYILDGGYHSFFETNRDHCEPQCYVEMGREGFEQDMERGLGLMKRKRATGRGKLKRSGLLERSQTFTFGSMDVMDEDNSPGVCRGNECSRGRRMMTY